MNPESSPTVVAIFTALGTIVGYLGAEVSSASMFDRILWPTRYYSTAQPATLLWMAALMPMGGPIHRAAVAALDELVAAGLWRGRLRGDMLGTVFYRDYRRRYIKHQAHQSDTVGHEIKEARNALWIAALDLVPWPRQVPPRVRNSSQNTQARARRLEDILSQRAFFELELSRETAAAPAALGNLPMSSVVTDDIGPLKLRSIVGIVMSETITIVFGIATAAVWKSPFAAWYAAPLLLKLVALFCHVRRRPIKGPDEMNPPGDDGKPTLFEVSDESKGFYLITGPEKLVYQFFHHYGHPSRSSMGLHWDKHSSVLANIDNIIDERVREIISMLIILAFVFVYPAGLVAFVFASADIQWVWLGYQLTTMLSMHCYRFLGGEHRGSIQEWLARELYSQMPVCFDDGSNHRLIAQLQSDVVDSVETGRAQRSKRVKEFEDAHSQNAQNGVRGTTSQNGA
jgi:hypothetical protein